LRHSLILILSLLSVACSWSHKPLQPLEREAADRALRTAGTQLYNDPASASGTYLKALKQYRAMADIEGELWALSGIALSSRALQDSVTYLDSRERMDAIVKEISPDRDYIPLLLELQLAAASSDWMHVSELYRDNDSWPVIARLRILAYAIQAESLLGQDRSAHVKLALKLLRGQKRKLHRQGDLHALQIARTRYALAYHYLIETDLNKAEKQLNQALELDRLYGDFDALGYDNWLSARIYMARGQADKARAQLLKAQRLFEGSAHAAMQTRVATELLSLEKGE